MIALANRIDLMAKLGQYLSSNNEILNQAIDLANRNNAWFTPEYIRYALDNIAEFYLSKPKLEKWIDAYPTIAQDKVNVKTVGIVMAGNIPLVGFHDFLCGFIAGHQLKIKLSSKDTVLWQHIFTVLTEWNAEFAKQVEVAEMLKGCDAYIATGSNNSARYFEFYFEKYPHIIRKNRSSVAVLSGEETTEDLAALAKDVNIYFGLGCRNVTQIFVPKEYNFEALLSAFNKYISHIDHNKFKNNYDYQLALFLLNKQYYMSNGHLLLVESESVYAPISVVHFQYYTNAEEVVNKLIEDDQVQCISTTSNLAINEKCFAFGRNQEPSLTDYADGIDTMQFLAEL